MNIRKVKQVLVNKEDVVIYVPGHSISLRTNEQTERIEQGQKMVLVYNRKDQRPLMCICGRHVYFLKPAPVIMAVQQTNDLPSANDFAGIREHSLDRTLFLLVRLNQWFRGHKR